MIPSAPVLHFIRCLGPERFHEMAYWQWGDDDAPKTMVCVHGLTRNGRDFDGLAPDLVAMGYRVICPDIVGRGRSDNLPNPLHYHYGQYLNDLTVLLGYLAVDKIDWLGTSMGGLLGMMMAAIPGNPVRSLIINDVGAVIPVAALRRFGDYLGRDPVFHSLAEAEAYFRLVLAPFGQLTDAQWQHLTQNSVRTRPDQTLGPAYDPMIAEPFRQNLPTEDLTFWPVWQAITVPVLMIRGGESDLFLDKTALEMKALKPDSGYLSFDQCGHAPLLWDLHQRQSVTGWLR